MYVSLDRRKFQTALEFSEERHIRNEGSWNYDFSSSQVGEDVPSGEHISRRLLRVKENKQKAQTQWSHGIEYCALNTSGE